MAYYMISITRKKTGKKNNLVTDNKAQAEQFKRNAIKKGHKAVVRIATLKTRKK